MKNVHYNLEFSKLKLIKFAWLDPRLTNQLSNSGITSAMLKALRAGLKEFSGEEPCRGSSGSSGSPCGSILRYEAQATCTSKISRSTFAAAHSQTVSSRSSFDSERSPRSARRSNQAMCGPRMSSSV